MANSKEISKKETQTPAKIEQTRTTQMFVPKVDIYERGDDTVLLGCTTK